MHCDELYDICLHRYFAQPTRYKTNTYGVRIEMISFISKNNFPERDFNIHCHFQRKILFNFRHIEIKKFFKVGVGIYNK